MLMNGLIKSAFILEHESREWMKDYVFSSLPLYVPSSCLYKVFTLFLQLVGMRNRILTESVADTHSFVSGYQLRECNVLP